MKERTERENTVPMLSMTGEYIHHYTNRATFDLGQFIIEFNDRLAAKIDYRQFIG